MTSRGAPGADSGALIVPLGVVSVEIDERSIANLFGVKRAAVSNWIAGRAVPSLRIGLGIQAFLNRQRRR